MQGPVHLDQDYWYRHRNWSGNSLISINVGCKMGLTAWHALSPSEAATHSNALGASIYCVPQRLRSHMPHPASEVQGVQSPTLLPPPSSSEAGRFRDGCARFCAQHNTRPVRPVHVVPIRSLFPHPPHPYFSRCLTSVRHLSLLIV